MQDFLTKKCDKIKPDKQINFLRQAVPLSSGLPE